MTSAAEPLVFRGWSPWGLGVMARSVAFTWKATGNHGQEDFQRRTWQVPPGCVGPRPGRWGSRQRQSEQRGGCGGSWRETVGGSGCGGYQG